MPAVFEGIRFGLGGHAGGLGGIRTIYSYGDMWHLERAGLVRKEDRCGDQEGHGGHGGHGGRGEHQGHKDKKEVILIML